MEDILEKVQTLELLNDVSNVHGTFLKKYIPELVKYLPKISNPYLIHNIQVFLNKKLKLLTVEVKYYTHPYLFLLMIDPSVLLWLKKLLGALFCLKEIKKVIDKQKKKELLAFLGEEVYFFVIKQGDLYVPFIEKINGMLEPEFSVNSIETIGQFLLEYLWCRQPECLVQRFVLRFDAGLSWNFRHVVDSDLQNQLLVLCKRLLKQREKIGLC